MTHRTVIALSVGAMVAVILADAYLNEKSHDAKVASASTPAELVTVLVDEPKANVRTDESAGVLNVRIDLAPWALTASAVKSQFDMLTVSIVKGVFTKFSDVERINVVGYPKTSRPLYSRGSMTMSANTIAMCTWSARRTKG
jgi:hypothetical protein